MSLIASRLVPTIAAILGGWFSCASVAQGASVPQDTWMNWRGPLASGVAPQADPPSEWSETRNVRWKIPPAGKGHSSPIVVGSQVIVVSAIPVGEGRQPVFDQAPGSHDNKGVTHLHQFVVQSLGRKDGREVWRKVLKEEFPHEGGHETGSLASNSPTSDGAVHSQVVGEWAGLPEAQSSKIRACLKNW